MSGHSLVPLRDLILESQNGLTKRSGADGMETPVLRLANITAGSIDESDPREIRLTAKELAKYALQLGDLVCIRVNGSKALVGRVIQFRANRVWAYCDHFIRLRPNQALVDHRYLAHYFNSQTVRRHIELNMVSSAGQNTVSQGTMLDIPVPCPGLEVQREIVAELEKQFSRLDEAVANLQRVKANLQRYEKSTIESLTSPETFDECFSGTVADIAISLDNMRKPVNKAERATRQGNVPYLGANGQTGWIDDHLFDEEIVLVVEDETFVGRTAPFCYYFAGKCWVNNHTHVLRAKPGVVSPKYLNLALSYYPFIPLTTGSTGRRKLTKGALMVAPIVVPSLAQQKQIVLEVERRLSLTSGVLAEVKKSLQRSGKLRQAVLATAFGIKSAQPEH